MLGNRYQKKIEEFLTQTDIRLNGNNPWDPQIHNEDFYARVIAQGTLGFGESYMDGWWDCEQLDGFITRLLRANLHSKVSGWKQVLHKFLSLFINFQTPSRSFQVGEKHYDIGNDLYSKMLGKRWIYSCGYWKNAKNLDEAQEEKLDLVCRKLHLSKGMKVLDIGCGWCDTAKFAAQNYGVEVVGVTISKEQAKYGREICKGLPVEIRLQDYRKPLGTYDRVVSIGMFEHVGYKNYSDFFSVVASCLNDDGMFLLHTIGNNLSKTVTDPWIEKYIFPNSMIPSAKQISTAFEGLFVLEDWHNFGVDYDKTLLSWFDNFEQSWDSLKDKYGERFYRMWKYYLLCCAGSFRARHNQLWQIVLTKNGFPDGYHSPR